MIEPTNHRANSEHPFENLSKDDKTGSNVNSQPSSKETPATKGSGRNTNAKSTASNTNAKGQKDGYRASPLLPQLGIHAPEPVRPRTN